MNYKLVCWNDYSIPVPDKFNWMAQDSNDSWFIYTHKPIWNDAAGYWIIGESPAQMLHMIFSEVKAKPPQEGPPQTQLYWIDD